MNTNNDTNKYLILACHLSPLLCVGIILPLIVYIIKKDEGGAVVSNAKESLNFQLTFFIASIALAILMTILSIVSFGILGILYFIIPPLLILALVVLCILGAINSTEGKTYRYPYILRLVK